MIVISTQTYTVNIVFPQLVTALYHRTSEKKKKVDCGNILPCCSNLSLNHLFFLTPLKHCKWNSISQKLLQMQSLGSFSIPFFKARELKFEKEQQPFHSPCSNLTRRLQQEDGVLSNPSFQPSSPAGVPPPADQHLCNALPFNPCPQWHCTEVTNCHLPNYPGLPRDQAPACSPCTMLDLQRQSHPHISFVAQDWSYTKSRSIKADTQWLLRAEWSGRSGNHL